MGETDYTSNSLIRNQLSMESRYQENFGSIEKVSIPLEYEKITRPSSKTFKKPIVLNYGQRVQVVDFIDGVARLARNRGFIIANRSQLVKVGQPIEKACIIEGMMNSARKTKLDLEKELEKVVRTEKFLVKDLQEILSRPEEHPVVEELKYSNLHQSEEYSDDELFRLGNNISLTSKKSPKLKSIMEYTSNSSFPVSPSSCNRCHEDDESSVLHDVVFLNRYSHRPTSNTQSSGSCRKSVNVLMKNKKKNFSSKFQDGDL